ncbi:MAG TPA: IclR family transcriptional regulator [Chloroflexota bacterium]|nr:IclR family transcriptional regulator [Chloroflexota bacterium]
MHSLERAAAILGVLADEHRTGVRLTDLAARTQLSPSTAHRITTALVELGLAEQDSGSARFFPGLALVGLGAAAANRYGLAELAAPACQRLADRTGDTIYLSLRRGTEVVCVDRLEGNFPIKVLTWDVGDRRPLGLNASGLAILAALPDDDVSRIIDTNASRIERYTGHDPVGVHALVERTRRRGYAFNEGYSAPGMAAVAVPIRGSQGEPLASLCVAALDSRLDAERRETVIHWLRDEASDLSSYLDRVSHGLSAPLVRRLRPRDSHVPKEVSKSHADR